MQDIAIIGAGMAGLACATRLAAQGHSVVLFDKGRGPGGRMATRRTEVAGETVRFDHGAQYFTVRDAGFAAAAADWQEAGVVAPWPAAGADAMVGTPSMNAPIRHMAEALEVHWATRIDRIERYGEGWRVVGEQAAHIFRHVIIAIPAEQAATMLAPHDAEWSALAQSNISSPCWAVMAAFENPLSIGDTFRGTDIGWAARNSAKPGRQKSAGNGEHCGEHQGEHWVIHGSPDWSRTHLEEEPAQAAEGLLQCFFAEAQLASTVPIHLAAHRWPFAMSVTLPGPDFLWDAQMGLGVCGDWLAHPRVEGAWVSGDALAQAIRS